jgi:hypothetical protein
MSNNTSEGALLHFGGRCLIDSATFSRNKFARFVENFAVKFCHCFFDELTITTSANEVLTSGMIGTGLLNRSSRRISPTLVLFFLSFTLHHSRGYTRTIGGTRRDWSPTARSPRQRRHHPAAPCRATTSAGW